MATRLAQIALVVLATLASSLSANGSTGCASKPPRNGKCWKDALGLQWTVHGFDYHAAYIFSTPAHQNSWGYVNFNLSNNVVPYTAACSAASDQLEDFFYGTLNYTCTLPATAPAGAAVEFRFNRPTGELDITETIICTEKNTVGTFAVSGSTNLTLACTDVTTVNQNWTLGEIYSDREVKCALVDVTVLPYQVVG